MSGHIRGGFVTARAMPHAPSQIMVQKVTNGFIVASVCGQETYIESKLEGVFDRLRMFLERKVETPEEASQARVENEAAGVVKALAKAHGMSVDEYKALAREQAKMAKDPLGLGDSSHEGG